MQPLAAPPARAQSPAAVPRQRRACTRAAVTAIDVGGGRPRRHGPAPCSLWSREPDAFDLIWEQEEAARRARQAPDSVAQREAAVRAAAEQTAARAQGDALHAQLLERQQRREALRDRWDCCGWLWLGLRLVYCQFEAVAETAFQVPPSNSTLLTPPPPPTKKKGCAKMQTAPSAISCGASR
jgi:hypothetical protein